MISRDRLDATDIDKPLKHDVELLEAELVRAVLCGDVVTLGRLFFEDALLIDPQGNVLSKAQELDLYSSGDLTISTYESGEFILRAFDSTALVNLKVSIGGKLHSKPFIGIYRCTRTYLQKDGQWGIEEP
jgi:Domain of unknown function (DUF4440)